MKGNRPFSQQPFWQVIIVSQVRLAPVLMKVLFHSGRTESGCCSCACWLTEQCNYFCVLLWVQVNMASVLYDQMKCSQLESPLLFTWQGVTDLCFSENADAVGSSSWAYPLYSKLNGSIIVAPTSPEQLWLAVVPLFASVAKRKQFVVVVTSPVHCCCSVPV